MPANITGSWGSLFNWPLIGLHSILTQDGKLLSFGTDLNGSQGAVMYHDVWDPVSNTHTTIDHSMTTATDIFCANAVILPGIDKILISGGDARPFGDINKGVPDVNVYSTTTNQITPESHGEMTYARWYATGVSLNNGQVVQLGGSDRQGNAVLVPEIFTPGEGWRTLTGAEDSTASGYYDRAFVRTDGKVVYFNGSGNVRLLDTTGVGTLTTIGTLPFAYDWESSAIQFSTGKLLVNDTGTGLWVMDINGATPSYTKVGDISAERNFGSMTLLADGRVLINGGSTVTNDDNFAVKTTVIWDPADNSVTDAGVEAVPRLYHSSSILLPDGSVLSMGGGAGGPLLSNQQNGQIYKPSYLFDDNGNLAARPTVVEVPEHVQSGTTFTIQVDDAADIAKITFVKAGAVTHDFNMNSGFTELTFTVGPNNTITVYLPGAELGINAGSWMLFVWDAAGVPSVAPIIEVDPVFNTGAAVDPGNLLTNGSFETAATIANASNEVLDEIVGWQSSANNFEFWKSGYNGVAAADGATYIEMDAERGTIYQDVKTTAGQTYDLTFAFSGRPGFIESSKMEVLWNGVVVSTISPFDAGFRAYSFTVTGTGGNDVLSFRSLATDTDAAGGLLDHVVLKAEATAAANLIANGNMESPVLPGSVSSQTFSNAQMDDWTNAGADKVVIAKEMGSQTLDLDPSAAPDALYQDIQTISGQVYTLSFDAIATVAGTSGFDVLWNGVKIETIDPSTTALQRFNFAVQGTGGLDRLTFRELAGQNDQLGSYVDNVTLVEGLVAPLTANLLANGNMENPQLPDTALKQTLTNEQSIGWKNGGSDNVVLVKHQGSQMLALDPQRTADELYQLVQTSASQVYALSFDAIGTAARSSAFDVLWNGVKIAAIDPGMTSLQHFTFRVTGTGGLDKLSFREIARQTNSVGAYLDNVSLIASVVNPQAVRSDGHEGNHILGASAADIINGTINMDHVQAGRGNDTINAAGGNDVIEAERGNDLIDGSFGADLIDGGVGKDTVTFQNATSGVIASLLSGEGTRGDAMGDTYINVEYFIGSAYDDVLILGNLGGGLEGLAGNDKLYGGSGNDALLGGAGDDALHGGAANDKLDGQEDNDILFGDTGNDVLSGGDGSDELFGGDGADQLDGGTGVDLLNGGAGADRLTGGLGDDTFQFSARTEGGDKITDFSSAATGNDDSFSFVGSAFGLTVGDFTAANFQSGTSSTALNADVRIFYETDTRILRFDADGSGAIAPNILATLQADATVTFSDIFIV